MKRVISVILSITMLFTLILSAHAATDDISVTGKNVVSYGDWMLEKINNGSQWELDEYKGSDSHITAPRIIDNMLVVAFGDYCFINNTTIKDVVTSSPLWTIGEYAFIDCTSLESVELNYALKTIGIGAFSGTSSLKDINLEDSIVAEIKPFTFLNSGIEEITLPDTCASVGNYAFGQCAQLSKITIPASVTEIHEDAFKGSESVVIYCYTDSYAHQYAEAKGIEYMLIDAPIEVTFMLGDADGDGRITIMDATKAQRLLAELITDEDGMIALRGDVSSDKLDILDATKIQRHIAGFGIAEPVGTMVTKEIIPKN